jgi:FtsH-binding integral membrane protein
MPRYEMTGDNVFPPIAPAERVDVFFRAVYGWMCVGLGLTAATAWIAAGSPAFVDAMAANRVLFWGLVIAQLAIVVLLSARADRLAASTASGLFVIYSVLTGVTLSFVLLVFTGESIATTFVITAGMFGALALYGTATRRSLAGLGPVLFMGLIGVVLASLVGLFWQSDALQFVISLVGVAVFTGLTAYDAQRLNGMAETVSAERAGTYAIAGALVLYLDFVNLFLSLLRFFGRRRE